MGNLRSSVFYKLAKLAKQPEIIKIVAQFNLKAKKPFPMPFDNPAQLEDFRAEIEASGITEEFNQKAEEFKKFEEKTNQKGLNYSMGTVGIDSGLMLYSLMRTQKPELVVETGVCNGMSSALILLALDKNDKGTLHSIDLPEEIGTEYKDGYFFQGKGGSAVPPGVGAGWLVPDNLKSRWNLHLGKSQDILPPLLKEIGEIDIFIHDSEHSYECMKFEYETAYPSIRQGGVLVSDDVMWNNSFLEFAAKHKAQMIRLTRTMGMVMKG